MILGKQSSQQVGSWFAVGFLIASLAKIGVSIGYVRSDAYEMVLDRLIRGEMNLAIMGIAVLLALFLVIRRGHRWGTIAGMVLCILFTLMWMFLTILFVVSEVRQGRTMGPEELGWWFVVPDALLATFGTALVFSLIQMRREYA